MWSHRTSCPRRAAAEGHGRASRSRPASDRNGWEADIRTRFPRELSGCSGSAILAVRNITFCNRDPWLECKFERSAPF